MTKADLKIWWHKWWFGFVLSSLLISYQLASLITFISSTPKGFRWLGHLAFNMTDYPVYLNYLLQGKTHFLISNLYNNFSQIPRFDIFWSLGGLLVRAGLSPVMTHEILRWFCTVALALAVYATAKSLVTSERWARLASLFMLSGLSLGWIYSAWRDLGGPEFKSAGPTPPDLVTEFGVAPVLIGGAHMILSLALELLSVRWIYELICLKKKNRLVPLILVSLFFTWLHPYFIPLLGCQALICLVVAYRKKDKTKSLPYFLVVGASFIPAAGYYVYLALMDSAFKDHFLISNQLRLGSGWTWLLALLPLLWAAGRLLMRKVPSELFQTKFPAWALFWIISALICLALPFPWQRKYTQGLLMAGVILTLPYWLMVSESILSKWRTGIKRLFYLSPPHLIIKAAGSAFGVIFFIFFICAPYLYLFQIQLTTLRPDFIYSFYESNSLFSAWNFLESNQNNHMVITDNLWINLWTPAKTGLHVWIGHAHETPDYWARFEQYSEWLKTDQVDGFNRFLNENQINVIIATTLANQSRFERLIDHQSWQKTFEQSQITVWSKK
ncbi:MAG: hypothetical protein WC750_04965 [Patescibacteria group bacterium]|jgi:hypothetical protein